MRDLISGLARWSSEKVSAARRVVTRDLKTKIEKSSKTRLFVMQLEGDLPVVTCQKNSTGTSLSTVSDLVSGLDALLVIGSSELVSELVISDGTNVDYVFWWEDVLLNDDASA